MTDSTAALPADVVEYYRIRVVPLQIRIGSYQTDEDNADRDGLAAALRSGMPVSTAPPPPTEFRRIYDELVMSGKREVVSLHISARLSATAASAQEAAARVAAPVHVLDSLTSGMSLGFLTMAAAEAAAAGANADDIARFVEERRHEFRQLIYVDTLEYLRRGGRIGKASNLLGSALALKPVLTLADGEIKPVARVAGASRALGRLVHEGVKVARGAPVDAAVEYFGEAGNAMAVANALRERLPQLRRLVVTRNSTVIAAHLGPDSVGVAIAPAETPTTVDPYHSEIGWRP
ncbi:MAG TPA: DegV family protein [Micromonosporaceae bacterium]